MASIIKNQKALKTADVLVIISGSVDVGKVNIFVL